MLVFEVEVENRSQVQRADLKLSYSLACRVRCKVNYFGKYSSRGIQCSLMCLTAPVISLLWIAVDHEHTMDDILSQGDN